MPRHVVVGFARMDDQRQPGLARRRDVAAEAGLLGVARAEIVVIVEPGLADGDHLGVAAARDQVLDGEVELLMCVVRMRSYGAVDIGESLGDRQQAIELAHPGRDGDHAPYPGRPGALDDRVEVVGEVGKIEMAMAVDEHGHRPASAAGST